MAITPNSYPFSGGAFMGGGGSPVNRDDIHTLNLTKNGESIGNYNPLVGDADVDVPSDAVVIGFSTFSGAMPGSAYSKMASAVGAGQVVMLRSVSGASVVYWTLLAASVLSYKFISVSETAVLTVEIQTSGDSSGNHAFTISNVPLTELRVIDTGASSGDDRGHEHTRITEALAAGKTVCIKYTSGNNIAYGTLCGAHDGHYTFIVDYGGTPSVLTVIADGSMQISAIFDGDASEFSVTPDGSSIGYNITGPTLLKVFLQKFKNLVSALKALAFKDKVSDSDISGTISDNRIASASTWNGKQDSLGISSSGDTDKFLNERGDFVTPDYPSVPSVINNLTSDSTTNALSAAQGKVLNDGKASNTLINVYGIRPSTLNISGLTGNTWYNIFDLSVGTYTSIPVAIKIQGRNLGLFTLSIRWPHSESATPTQFSIDSPNYANVGYTVDPNNSRLFHIWLKTPGGLNVLSAVYEAIGNGAAPAVADGTMTATGTEPTNLVRPSYSYPIVARGGKGSPTTPVYVDPDGQVQECDVLSGGTSNFNRTFTTTYTVGSTDQYITTVIKNDNSDLIADYVTWHNANVGKLTSPPMIIITLSARTAISNAGLITLNMYKNGNGCDVFGEKYAYMGNQHDSNAYNTQYFTDQTFVSGSAYYLNIRNETPNTMWAAGTILDISIHIVAHAVSVT